MTFIMLKANYPFGVADHGVRGALMNRGVLRHMGRDGRISGLGQ